MIIDDPKVADDPKVVDNPKVADDFAYILLTNPKRLTIHIGDDGSNWRLSMHGLETSRMTFHGRISWRDEANGSNMSLAWFTRIGI